MKQQEPTHVTQQLQDVPAGGLTIVRNSPSGQEYVLLTGQFSAKTVGKGKIEAYHVFPGVDASYNLLSAAEITVHHAASSSVLELFYCRNGRVGWNMRGPTRSGRPKTERSTSPLHPAAARAVRCTRTIWARALLPTA